MDKSEPISVSRLCRNTASRLCQLWELQAADSALNSMLYDALGCQRLLKCSPHWAALCWHCCFVGVADLNKGLALE